MNRWLVAVVATLAVAVIAVAVSIPLLGSGDDDDPRGSGSDRPSSPSGPSSPSSPSSPSPTTVSPPGGGTVEETVPPRPRGEVLEADSDGTAVLPDGVTVRLADARTITVEAVAPGDVSGPALVLDLELANNSPRGVSVDTVTVTTQYGEMVAQPLTAEPAAPFSGTLDPGGIRKASYVFAIPSLDANSFVTLVEYVAGARVARFDVVV